MRAFMCDEAKKFDMEEIWYLEQTLLSTCKSKILDNIRESKETADDAINELIDSILIKLEALTQEEFENLFHDLADHIYMPDGEWEE